MRQGSSSPNFSCQRCYFVNDYKLMLSEFLLKVGPADAVKLCGRRSQPFWAEIISSQPDS